jgi:SAM-dependent methyltransferase
MANGNAEPFRIDDSRIPVILGSALKVPSYAYPNWGIPEGHYRPESDDLYSVEWEGGSKRQMEYVVEAIKRTGLGNFSQMLRDGNAEKVSHIVQEKRGKVNYLEPGAGVSTINVYKKLLEDGVDIERVFTTMMEPSADRLEGAAGELEKIGLKRNKNFVVYRGKKDTDALALVGPRSQDIIGTVAQMHHHAYLDVPMITLALTLKKDGYLVCADWHNSMWEHPNRVYEFLKNDFDWETKNKDLAAFRRMFPKATETAPALEGSEEMANKMIRSFWRNGWAEVRKEAIEKGEFQPCDDILMLEGHRPVGRYMDTGETAAGLSTKSCTPLVDGSSILNVLLFQNDLHFS